VVVVGGGDSAADEALVLADVASRVTVLVRRDELRAVPALAERLNAQPKVSIVWNTTVEAIEGTDGVERVRVRDGDGRESTLDCNGVFIYVGLQPNTLIFRDVLPMDPMGHIPVDAWMRTAVPGLFAAGDVRQHSARQLVTAAGDGATAAIAAARYLRSGEWPAVGEIASGAAV
jgi:thioredoxin reductase (NADPH)